MLQIGTAEHDFADGLSWQDKLDQFTKDTELVYETVMKASIIGGEQTLPIAITLSENMLATIFPQQDNFDKDQFHNMIGTYCQQHKVKQLFFISEVWYTKHKQESKESNFVMPSQSADKQEALLRTFVDMETKTGTIIMEEIIRNGDSVKLDVPEILDLKPESMETGMFKRFFSSNGQLFHQPEQSLDAMFRKLDGGTDGTFN